MLVTGAVCQLALFVLKQVAASDLLAEMMQSM